MRTPRYAASSAPNSPSFLLQRRRQHRAEAGGEHVLRERLGVRAEQGGVPPPLPARRAARPRAIPSCRHGTALPSHRRAPCRARRRGRAPRPAAPATFASRVVRPKSSSPGKDQSAAALELRRHRPPRRSPGPRSAPSGRRSTGASRAPGRHRRRPAGRPSEGAGAHGEVDPLVRVQPLDDEEMLARGPIGSGKRATFTGGNTTSLPRRYVSRGSSPTPRWIWRRTGRRFARSRCPSAAARESSVGAAMRAEGPSDEPAT